MRTDLQLELRSKEKQRVKANAKNDSERGYCIRWVAEGQCAFGEACVFKHDPNKKGRGKGPRSPSPTGSPHRNSEKVAMTKVLKAYQKLTGESPSGKANRLPCTNLKKGSCQRCNKCNYWQFGDKVCIAIHTPSNDERQMQLRKIQSDSKTQFPIKTSSSREQVCSRRRTWDPCMESSRPHLGISGIQMLHWTLSMEAKSWKAAGIFHKNANKVPGSYSENGHRFFKPSPASSVSSLSRTTSPELHLI